MNPDAPLNDRTQLDAKEQSDAVEPRRAVLRRAFAVGCSALLPASLLGCGRQEPEADTAGTTDTQAPGEAPAPQGSGGQSATPPAAAPAAKVSKASVQYQEQPKGVQKCGNCIQFIPPNACKVVDGEISPEAWCALWVGQT